MDCIYPKPKRVYGSESRDKLDCNQNFSGNVISPLNHESFMLPSLRGLPSSPDPFLCSQVKTPRQNPHKL